VFKVSLGYTVRPCLKKTKTQTKTIKQKSLLRKHYIIFIDLDPEMLKSLSNLVKFTLSCYCHCYFIFL
jgi:hypothetical protein